MDNKLVLPCDVSQVSDGYHTFAELYEHRCILFANLADCYEGESFKTWRNQNGEKWDGWFILGINTRFGQITYHLPDYLWERLPQIKEIESNADYDGHTSKDVIDRLKLLLSGAV